MHLHFFKMFQAAFAFIFINVVSSELLIINPDNSTEVVMVDLELPFTASLPEDGLMGQIVAAEPDEACEKISPPPFPSNSTLKWFVLIKKCQCSLEDKVRHAQDANFEGVVIYNVGSKCKTENHVNEFKITIPGVLIGESDGRQINKSYQYDKGYVIVINPDSPFNLNNYLLPFAVIIGISFLVMFIFMVVKCIKDRRRDRRNRLSSRHLKQLPTQKFKKGDEYDVCAICLEEYCEGEKLRILPCSHAYHTKCIDPWLTNNRRTCPVCKRKVVLKGFTPDSDDDSEDESPTERTPLIRSEVSSNRIDGGTFSGSFSTPLNANSNVRESSVQGDDSVSSSDEMYQSAVYRHSSPQDESIDIDEAVASSSQFIAPAAHSINSEDGFESFVNNSSSESNVVCVHTTQDSSSKKRKQDLVV